jgi:hypothetical protein
MEGGSIKLSFRIGSNDVDDEEIGILCGKLGSEITFTLIAPEVKEEPPVIDGTTAAFERDHPDAGALFAAEHGDDGLDSGGTGADSEGGETDISDSAAEGWPFPKNAPGDAPPQSATVENSRPGTRTARGRDKTKAALAAGAAAAGVDA